MTPAEFVTMIAPLEAQGLTVVKYGGLKDTYPRLVWREWYISQWYAGNRAYERRTTIYAELYTKTEDDPLLAQFMVLCDTAELPFECPVDYDETTGVIHYAFSINLGATVGG